ncbi:MAG: hypothetical protein JOZ19_00765 [Rubrobacter sp.]|nr:hypothetical protein [Rubrobacter sp.]
MLVRLLRSLWNGFTVAGATVGYRGQVRGNAARVSMSAIHCASCTQRIPDHEPDLVLEDLSTGR